MLLNYTNRLQRHDQAFDLLIGKHESHPEKEGHHCVIRLVKRVPITAVHAGDPRLTPDITTEVSAEEELSRLLESHIPEGDSTDLYVGVIVPTGGSLRDWKSEGKEEGAHHH
ncbi:MAG TPA: hypothetical protein VD794_15990 [Flavisolibacter sp.]|nr:hypothetical protein [Flavisolibacter sp.]